MAKGKNRQRATTRAIEAGFRELGAQLQPLRQLVSPSVGALSREAGYEEGFKEGFDRGFRAGLEAAAGQIAVTRTDGRNPAAAQPRIPHARRP